MLKILIFGSGGMLGKDVADIAGKNNNVILPTTKNCDITDWTSVELLFKKIRHADCVINCAAYTNVDKCEESSKKAFAVNAAGPQIIAKCCEKMNIPLIHVSTDYVFDGEKSSYNIIDTPNPQTIYGRSKLLGEQHIRAIMSRYFIVRTAWLFGQNGRNFVSTILNYSKKKEPLRVVSDQVGSPTYTIDLATAIMQLMTSTQYGIHHISGEGSCSWYEFAKTILELKNIDKEIIPISTNKSFDLFETIKANRPKSSILENTIKMRLWKEALEEYLNKNIDSTIQL